MARLPVPGGDDDIWGDVLNEFLEVEHNEDGTLNTSGTLGAYAPLNNPTFTGSVTVPTPSNSTDAVTKQYTDNALLSKANDNEVVKLSGAQSIADIKTFTSQVRGEFGSDGKFIIGSSSGVGGLLSLHANASDADAQPSLRLGATTGISFGDGSSAPDTTISRIGSSNIGFDDSRLSNISDPTDAQDAVTKSYHDQALQNVATNAHVDLLTITSETPTVSYTHADRISDSLVNFPDSTMGIGMIGDNQFAAIGANSTAFTVLTFSGDSPMSDGTVIQSGLTLSSPKTSMDYAGGGQFIDNTKYGGTTSPILYHGEEIYNGTHWSFLGLANLAVPGMDTITDLGRIIEPELTNAQFSALSATIDGAADIGSGSVAYKNDGYVYILYKDYALNEAEDDIIHKLAIARCAIDDFDTAVSNDEAPLFFKYYNGSWNSPGLGGPATDLLPANSYALGAWGIHWTAICRAKGVWILVSPHMLNDEYGINYRLSSNLIDWTTPKWLIEPVVSGDTNDPELFYPTLVPKLESNPYWNPYDAGDSGNLTLFYTYGDRWDDLELRRTDLSLQVSDLQEATLKSDTTLVDTSYFLDEDDMASNDDTKVPSQQSVKAYVDNETSALISQSNKVGSTGFRSKNLDNWFAALEQAPTTPANIVVIGDSISTSHIGFGAWPWQIANMLSVDGATRAHPDVHFVFAKTVNLVPAMDSCQGSTVASGMGGWSSQMSNGQTGSHTANIDGFTILYTQHPSGGQIEVRDGGPSGTLLTTIETSGSQKGSMMWTSNALTSGSHEIHVTAVCGAGENVLLEGIYLHYGTRSRGVRVWPAGHAGYTSAQFTTQSDLALDLIENIDPDLVIIATGTNDGFSDPSSYDTAIRNLITAVKTKTDSDLALWIPYINDQFTKSEAATGRQIVDDLGLGLIDGSVGLGDWSVNGDPDLTYSYDNVHPSGRGNAVIASHVYSIIGGNPIGAMSHALASLRFKTETGTQSWELTNGKVTIENFFGVPMFRIYDANTHPSISLDTHSLGSVTGTTSSTISFGSGSAAADAKLSRLGTGQLGINNGEGTLAANLAPKLNIQTGTSYTLVLSDAGKQIIRSNASASTQTLPSNSDAAIPVGTIIPIFNFGAGDVTIQAGSGATVGGDTTLAEMQRATMTKIDSDSWFVALDNGAGSGGGDVTLNGVQTLTNKTLTSPVIDTGVSGTAIDTDATMAANSDTLLASQKATKSYVNTVTANNQTGTSYTLVLSDAGKVIECNNASTVTVTVPLNSSVAFPVGTVIEIWRQGAGAVNISPVNGSVTIRSPGGATQIDTQYASAVLRKRATDEWVLDGSLS